MYLLRFCLPIMYCIKSPEHIKHSNWLLQGIIIYLLRELISPGTRNWLIQYSYCVLEIEITRLERIIYREWAIAFSWIGNVRTVKNAADGDKLKYIYMHHDDVIKWKHFPPYWSFVRGSHRSPVYPPHKGQWCVIWDSISLIMTSL